MWKKRIVSSSFWVIMAIHLVVFACIGIFTPRGWSLLIIFICGLAVTLALLALLRRYARRHPDKRWVQGLRLNRDKNTNAKIDKNDD